MLLFLPPLAADAGMFGCIGGVSGCGVDGAGVTPGAAGAAFISGVGEDVVPGSDGGVDDPGMPGC
ncbi:hypothetical protein KC963_02880 [Candidatus Saccharibacteria bacterium]|nr:hypothetical protein [Candidatus Saccharibacteria bacterium]